MGLAHDLLQESWCRFELIENYEQVSIDWSVPSIHEVSSPSTSHQPTVTAIFSKIFTTGNWPRCHQDSNGAERMRCAEGRGLRPVKAVTGCPSGGWHPKIDKIFCPRGAHVLIGAHLLVCIIFLVPRCISLIYESESAKGFSWVDSDDFHWPCVTSCPW